MILLNSASAINAYLGAWITAGIAVGGIIFAAIEAAAKAIAKFIIAKDDNKTKIALEREKTKQQQLLAEEKRQEQIKKAFQDYYTQTALSIYQEKQLESQIVAYTNLLFYISNVGYNSAVFEIQEDIKNGSFNKADQAFHGHLHDFKEEEIHLLSQSESHSPKEHKGDS